MKPDRERLGAPKWNAVMGWLGERRDSMGTYFDVPNPGIYTATVTTYQTSGHQYSDSIPFTIQ